MLDAQLRWSKVFLSMTQEPSGPDSRPNLKALDPQVSWGFTNKQLQFDTTLGRRCRLPSPSLTTATDEWWTRRRHPPTTIVLDNYWHVYLMHLTYLSSKCLQRATAGALKLTYTFTHRHAFRGKGIYSKVREHAHWREVLQLHFKGAPHHCDSRNSASL